MRDRGAATQRIEGEVFQVRRYSIKDGKTIEERWDFGPAAPNGLPPTSYAKKEIDPGSIK